MTNIEFIKLQAKNISLDLTSDAVAQDMLMKIMKEKN